MRAAACWLALGFWAAYAAQRLQVRTLSGRPDMATGGGVLAEISGPALNRATVCLNGRDIATSFRTGGTGRADRRLWHGASYRLLAVGTSFREEQRLLETRPDN